MAKNAPQRSFLDQLVTGAFGVAAHVNPFDGGESYGSVVNNEVRRPANDWKIPSLGSNMPENGYRTPNQATNPNFARHPSGLTNKQANRDFRMYEDMSYSGDPLPYLQENPDFKFYRDGSYEAPAGRNLEFNQRHAPQQDPIAQLRQLLGF